MPSESNSMMTLQNLADPRVIRDVMITLLVRLSASLARSDHIFWYDGQSLDDDVAPGCNDVAFRTAELIRIHRTIAQTEVSNRSSAGCHLSHEPPTMMGRGEPAVGNLSSHALFFSKAYHGDHRPEVGFPLSSLALGALGEFQV